MHFEFPFNLIGKLTMALLTGQSWQVPKSWYTGGGPGQGFWHCFADRLNQKFIFYFKFVTYRIYSNSAQPRISAHPTPSPSQSNSISAHPHPTYLSDNEIEIEIE